MTGVRSPAHARGSALVATVLVAVLAFAVVAFATDGPRLARPRGELRATRAAFAVRDLVPPFQQWGSRAFSVPLLESAYGRVEYLTLRTHGDEGKLEFQARLRPLLEAGVAVDLFLLAHTNHFVDWVRELDPAHRARMRLVYNTGCFNLAQRDEWLQLGAQAYVGHVGSSASYVFYVPFLRGWVRGGRLDALVEEGNAFTTRRLAWVATIAGFDARAVAAASRAEVLGVATLTIDGGVR